MSTKSLSPRTLSVWHCLSSYFICWSSNFCVWSLLLVWLHSEKLVKLSSFACRFIAIFLCCVYGPFFLDLSLYKWALPYQEGRILTFIFNANLSITCRFCPVFITLMNDLIVHSGISIKSWQPKMDLYVLRNVTGRKFLYLWLTCSECHTHTHTLFPFSQCRHMLDQTFLISLLFGGSCPFMCQKKKKRNLEGECCWHSVLLFSI